MPRITPLRVLFSLVATYPCLVGLWLGLPSPRHTTVVGNNVYHQRILRNGETITTIHPTSQISSRVPPNSESRSAFAIDWQLIPDCKTGSVILRVGENTRLNLTDITLRDSDAASRTQLNVTAKAGDTDGVNPPWFPHADAVLLYWAIHRDSVELDLVAEKKSPGSISIGTSRPSVTDPRMILTNIPIDPKSCDISQIFVSGMDINIPSATYLLRHYIVTILAPITLAIVAITSQLSVLFTVIAYLSIIVLAIYLFQLYRNRREQGSKFRRSTKRSIWSATGPLSEAECSEDSDLVQSTQRNPAPLTSIFAFFRSSSPLDDLCMTFDATRWMVQPLREERTNVFTTNFDVESAVSQPAAAKISIKGLK